MIMWVVYDHPSDMPDYFVARKWNIDIEPIPTSEIYFDKEISKLREIFIDMGLMCILRLDGDDPKIIETWF